MIVRTTRSHRLPRFSPDAALGLLLGGLLALPMMASAQNASDRSELRSLGRCEGCSFEELDLSGRRMTSVDLSESSFTNVDFSDAELNIAIFDNARLEDVSFDSADLGGASFTGATLINVSFEGADLTAAVFEGAILEATDLQAGELCFTQMPNELTNSRDCS
ncbi:pentapeptide repeat-containing protein [Roseovarius sp. SCSIO 43702]|uniref:pentapeptide repeat-containing protein n=1 Tax=Roseovarius sp. SCSIO 43702 TaxID=2823043 RepID=UPI002175C264|nr:pentapeptide repeat-containing protein [Roseovarius sp. SCSIO 43702]